MYRGDYHIIGVELSMFSRKLEAQLRYQKIPHRWEFKTFDKTAEWNARGGTHFIPLLKTPDGWVINDTIAIGPMLDQRFSANPVIPHSPAQRAICFILEDFFNNWLGRLAIHTRWCYPDNVAWVAIRMGLNTVLNRSIEAPFSQAEAAQLAPLGEQMRDSFGLPACRNNGVPAECGAAVRQDYTRLMGLLADHLGTNAYLLGGRACLADFILAGAAKAHFITDPEPRAWLGDQVGMLESYVERVFDGDCHEHRYPDDDQIPTTLTPLLEYMRDTYQCQTRAIFEGLTQGDKTTTYDCGYGPTTVVCQKRLGKAIRHVQDELLQLGEDGMNAAQNALGRFNILELYREG